MIYTGIGSRDLKWKGIDQTFHILNVLNSLNYSKLLFSTFRSGGATGADVLFEIFDYGLDNTKKQEIFLPWKGFNGSKSELYNISDEAKVMAKHYHPAPQMLNDSSLKLMARNCYQVLGLDLKTPTDFIVCWTPDEIKGGTSQALRIAADYKIPVFNLFKPEAGQLLKEYLS